MVIAHRVSSALRARRVLLLDGRTALLDTHEGLLTRSAAYRALVGYGETEREPSAVARCWTTPDVTPEAVAPTGTVARAGSGSAAVARTGADGRAGERGGA